MDNKEIFRQFLECTMTPETASKYLIPVDKFFQVIQEEHEEYNSLWEVEDPELYDSMKAEIEENESFISKNNTGKGMYSRGLDLYGKFLRFRHFYDETTNVNLSLKNPSGKSNLKSTLRPSQVIYYGTPGSGKSNKVKKTYDNNKKYSKHQIIRTTFHPDTDYANFVGGYKPVPTKDKDGKEKISYKFVPQCFTNAYVRAWNDLGHPYFLIIEEINRGNCAQIFGDTFQLLDRNKDGYSEYPIDADTDLKNYLEKGKDDDGNAILTNKTGIADGQICLPPNLSIIATMNTSDQSLFPMDTAFKRRWSWEYVPIDYDNKDSSQFKITIGDKEYEWNKFLKAVNAKIKHLTDSEDKQMGNFFIKHSVDEKEFVNKVMYYLWSEVGKDNYQTSDALFRRYKDDSKTDKTDFSFNELYVHSKEKPLHETDGTQKLLDFIDYVLEEDISE